ncbi:MAG: efflux RND transporter periplasmic adaptor subunit [Thermodesulfobacteriota bacterium]|nr:efflux RND transporter periplasmic adaptor subunit [Thermodesulfobacteriota bacterium]
MKRLRRSRWPAVLIALVGCATTLFLLAQGEEEPLREVRRKVLSVETVVAQKADYRVRVPAWGLVEPRETIYICTEISGMITHVPADVFAGAAVKQGALLFSIDERDYQNTLAEAMAANEQARQALEIEKGRQTVAKTEWKLLEDSKWLGHKNQALALREPHLKEREAAVQMAAARQAQAALDVERTRITAPCEGVILAEDLAEGQVLDIGDVAVRMACTDSYYIMASFSPQYSLDPGEHQVAVGVGPHRYEGIVKAVLPQINSETRQKQALIEFKGEGVSLGAYASLTLPGPSFENVVVLPKEALRPGNTVWVLSENSTLKIRTVTVLAEDMVHVVIGKGLAGRDRVVLSHIASPLEGMELRVRAPLAEGPQNPISNEENGE